MSKTKLAVMRVFCLLFFVYYCLWQRSVHSQSPQTLSRFPQLIILSSASARSVEYRIWGCEFVSMPSADKVSWSYLDDLSSVVQMPF